MPTILAGTARPTLEMLNFWDNTMELPDSFHAKEVEVADIPYPKSPIVSKGDNWQNDFLFISQWEVSEDDIKMKSWPVQEF